MKLHNVLIRPTDLFEEILRRKLISGGGGAVLQTVTGISPLTLLNVASKGIKTLTQFGKCAQTGTPTPSAPINIKCNNGTLKMVDDELPTGYKRVANIKFDGDLWYETGEVLKGDDDVTMTLDGTSSTGQNVFGSYNGTASGVVNFSLFIYGGGSASGSYFRYGTQLIRPRFGTGERTITFGKSGTDGFLTDVTATPDTFTTPANAYIGMLPNSTSPAFTGTIVGNITVGTRLKWIPCERTADGAVGYYEAVSGVFLEPSGTGTPVKGAYDYTHAHLEVVGTPEVLTVVSETAQTASVENLFGVGDYKDEQNIVSGEVARKVGVKILDGTEEWTTDTYGGSRRFVTRNFAKEQLSTVVCTHYSSTIEDGARTSPNNAYVAASGALSIYRASTQSIDTVEDWKAYLAGQYANGTPVVIVCPLAEATTEQVTAQHLTARDTATITVQTNNISDITLEVEYWENAE